MATTDTSLRSPLQIARELAPLIRLYADQIEETRELPRPLFEALADAGLFRLLIPRSLGGSELDLPTYIQVIGELAKADASTAWCINQGGVFATHSARMPREVASLIWVETPRSVVANSPVPDGTAIAAKGGYRVTARQGFSTGSRHAAWLAANARILEDGRPRLLADGQPETRYLFIPAAEAEILDTWHVRGMRGTGTHHFAVNAVFVPEERTFLASTAALREPGPLYVFPRTLLFGSGDAATALSVAHGSLEAFVELAGGKKPFRTPGLLSDQALVHFDIGRAEAQFRSGRALLTESVRDAWDTACATGAITLDQRVAIRLAITHAIRLAVEVVDTVYNAAGASAVFQSSPLQRYFQDIHVISQHIQSRRTNYELVGRFRLGVATEADIQRV